ncbi:MAG: UDP-N-acetylglucosamine 1-carboxyvinyltransferase [Calditrichaceae bacterium]
MSKFIIEGGNPLNGEIKVAGNKNAALPIIAAAALTDEDCIIENLPAIRDVDVMLEILADLGKSVERTAPNVYKISGAIAKTRVNDALANKLRASILYLSVILAKTGEVEMVPPGGCIIGRRNVDSHFDVIESFGATLEFDEKNYKANLSSPRAPYIFLKEASVTATENAMLLAASVTGETTIENAASEPHVSDLADVLKKMGAGISGRGTNRLSISGKEKLSGFRHRIMPDHIEAGTLAIAAAATKGEMIIHDAYREHLRMTYHYMKQMNIDLEFLDHQTLKVRPSDPVSQAKKIQVGLWPGFPTDLMSPMIVLATQAKGTTLCHDWMFEGRMFFVDKLIIMGAQIVQCDPHRVLVSGPTMLRGQELSSPDIRAGIALVIAALTARGMSRIDRVELVDRGYEDIAARLNKLGASIKREQ